MMKTNIDIEKAYKVIKALGLKYYENMPIPVGYVRFISKKSGEDLGLEKLPVDDEYLDRLIKQTHIRSIADALLIMKEYIEEDEGSNLSLEDSVAVLVAICMFSRCGTKKLVANMFDYPSNSEVRLDKYERRFSTLGSVLMLEAITREDAGLTGQFHLSKRWSRTSVAYGGEFFTLLELEKQLRVLIDTEKSIERYIEDYLFYDKEELLITPESLKNTLLKESSKYYEDYGDIALVSFVSCLEHILKEFEYYWEMELICKPVTVEPDESIYSDEYTELCIRKCVGVLITGVEFYD